MSEIENHYSKIVLCLIILFKIIIFNLMTFVEYGNTFPNVSIVSSMMMHIDYYLISYNIIFTYR